MCEWIQFLFFLSFLFYCSIPYKEQTPRNILYLVTLLRPSFIFFFRQSDYLQKRTWNVVSTYLQVSECLILSWPSPRPCHILLILLRMFFLDCPTLTCPSGLSLEGTFSIKISLIYVQAPRSGTASVLPWHPAPCSTCNFFLVGSTSPWIVSPTWARVGPTGSPFIHQCPILW